MKTKATKRRANGRSLHLMPASPRGAKMARDDARAVRQFRRWLADDARAMLATLPKHADGTSPEYTLDEVQSWKARVNPAIQKLQRERRAEFATMTLREWRDQHRVPWKARLRKTLTATRIRKAIARNRDEGERHGRLRSKDGPAIRRQFEALLAKALRGGEQTTVTALRRRVANQRGISLSAVVKHTRHVDAREVTKTLRLRGHRG